MPRLAKSNSSTKEGRRKWVRLRNAHSIFELYRDYLKNFLYNFKMPIQGYDIVIYFQYSNSQTACLNKFIRIISSPKFIAFYLIVLFSWRFWLSNQWWVLLVKNGVLDFKEDMMTMDTLINVYMEVTLKVRNSRTHVYLMWEKSLVVGFADVNNENKILTISLLYV